MEQPFQPSERVKCDRCGATAIAAALFAHYPSDPPCRGPVRVIGERFEVAGAITADGPIPSAGMPEGWGVDWV